MTKPVSVYWWRPLTGGVRQRALDMYNFRRRAHAGSRLSWHLRNFGDELTPELITRLEPSTRVRHAPCNQAELVSLGSILGRALRDARPGTLVVGSGLALPEHARFANSNARRGLDIRLVRGHLTRQALGLSPHLPVGDPALLLAAASPPLHETERRSLTVVLHYRFFELSDWRSRADELAQRMQARVVMSNERVPAVLRAIQESELVISTSLHGLIVADALGIPAISATTGEEGRDFRFDDYESALSLEPRALPSIWGMSRETVAVAAAGRKVAIGSAVKELGAQVAESLSRAVREVQLS